PWTPSALNTYLDCSLRFFFQYIAQLQATPSPQPATDALVFGNLLHTVMEKLYTPLLRQTALLQPQDFDQLQKAVVPTVQRVFMHTFQQGKQQAASVQGDQAIAQAIVTKMVRRMLTLDKAYAPFAIVGVELGRQTPLWLDFALDATTQVRLRGIIDRVDWKAGKFRVLDYKTGLDNKKLTSIASLFDREEPQRNKAAFQAFFYTWLFQQQGQHHLPAFVTKAATVTHCNVMPGLLNVRQLFDGQFDPRFYVQRPGSRQTMPIEAVKDYQEAWEVGLRQTLSDLLDPEVPFVQTKDERRCTSCPYKGICQRY
ncbi:MAG: PD-(D/E)XK nuclease family protein, partial [Bacteroidota bacterium]